MSGIWGILASQNTENGLLNAELWIFRFLLGFFMAHYAHFKFKAFLWLATLIFCVARLFVCGVGFLRDGFCEADGLAFAYLFGLFDSLFFWLLGFLPAFSLNKKATAWLLLSALKATR